MQSSHGEVIHPPASAVQDAKRWTTPADHDTIEKTIAALKQRGIHAELAPDGPAALTRLIELIRQARS